MFSLHGRAAPVTGAGVVTADIDPAAAASAAKEIEQAGGRAEPATLDVRDESQAGEAALPFLPADGTGRIINVNGGAIAPGHPVGATGARLFGTLIQRVS